jgi:hypothetical protein
VRFRPQRLPAHVHQLTDRDDERVGVLIADEDDDAVDEH